MRGQGKRCRHILVQPTRAERARLPVEFTYKLCSLEEEQALTITSTNLDTESRSPGPPVRRSSISKNTEKYIFSYMDLAVVHAILEY